MSLLGRRRDTRLRHGNVAGPGRGARPVDHGDGLHERDGLARVPGSATGPIRQAGDRR